METTNQLAIQESEVGVIVDCHLVGIEVELLEGAFLVTLNGDA